MVRAPATNRLWRLPDRTAEIVFVTTDPYREATTSRDLEDLLEAHWSALDYLRVRGLSLRLQIARARRMQWAMWLVGLVLGILIGRGGL